MPITLDLNKAQFFIAIAKKNSHSFVMLGTHENNRVQHLLARVGKFFDVKRNTYNEVEVCGVLEALTGAAFTSTKAKIVDEGIKREKLGHAAISYQAYELSYRQYLEFIRLLESVQTRKNPFFCYKPKMQKDKLVELEFTSERHFKARPVAGTLFAALNTLSINNNCRHGAITLIEEALGYPVSSQVSSNFFSNLPYNSYLDFGVPSSNVPFYVLPPPPTNIFNKEKKEVLEKLYQRMERMLIIEPDSKSTQKKFACLKDFYKQQIADEIREPSIERLLVDLNTWKKENYLLLNSLRKTYFWDDLYTRKSATLTMVEDIEKDLGKSHPISMA